MVTLFIIAAEAVMITHRMCLLWVWMSDILLILGVMLIADWMQFLSENHLNGCQISEQFSVLKLNLNWLLVFYTSLVLQSTESKFSRCESCVCHTMTETVGMWCDMIMTCLQRVNQNWCLRFLATEIWRENHRQQQKTTQKQKWTLVGFSVNPSA